MSNYYFKNITIQAEELTQKANNYLTKLPFLNNDEVKDRIWAKCIESGEQHGLTISDKGYLQFEHLNWEALPWYVSQTLDGWMPYSNIPHNGSLGFTLGFSVAALEANLRNILEILEGRETQELELLICAKY